MTLTGGGGGRGTEETLLLVSLYFFGEIAPPPGSDVRGNFCRTTVFEVDLLSCLYNKKNINKTLFHSLAAFVRKMLFCHLKIKFASPCRRVINNYSTSARWI